MASSPARRADGPLADLDDWESAHDPGKPESGFRDYRANVRPGVVEFYRLNHTHQTLDFVLEKKREYLAKSRRRMGIWEAMEYLNTLVDDSDPDTDLSQIEHLMQCAEAIRAEGHPRWMILTGLIHDLGKILCLFGEPQWAVVGDTFPVGCRYSDEDRLPRVLRREPRQPGPRVPDPRGHLFAALRPGQRPPVLGPRRVPLPRRQGLPPRRRAWR